MAVTTVLTVWALWGDDIRLSCTNKPADIAFNFATLFCLAVFLFEIVVSSIGKPDYFLGFFFWLDTVSTISLVLDLSWVNEELFGGETDAGGSSDSSSTLRAGRASRAGTRAGRVVRIIRLIRIVKLYKAVSEAEAKKRAKREAARLGPGNPMDDDPFLDDEDSERDHNVSESRVGKKLSDMTTRRVIVLVLAMLGAFQLIVTDNLAEELPTSVQYGAEVVHSSYLRWEKMRDSKVFDLENARNTGAATSPAISPQEALTTLRSTYEDQLLTSIYYHNWHAEGYLGCTGECFVGTPATYYNHIFWVGASGQNTERFADMHIQNLDIAEWEKQASTED